MAQESAHSRIVSGEQREHMMVQVAKLYHNMDRTQSEVAKELGLTRWQVGRLLNDAREVGIVRIEIIARTPRRPDLEARLQKAFGLKEAVVAAVGVEEEALVREGVARAAAQFISVLSPKPQLMGVSWGRTMSAVVRWVPADWNQNVQVVFLNGSTSRNNFPKGTNNVAEELALSGKGKAILLPVPAILGLESTRVALENDPPVADILRLADKAPLACFSLGSLSKHSVLVESGYLAPDDIEQLGARGAVGDILGRFINVDGDIVDANLDDRTLGLSPERLKNKPYSVGIAGGPSKHEVILAALRKSYLNVLISDEHTAEFLLKRSR